MMIVYLVIATMTAPFIYQPVFTSWEREGTWWPVQRYVAASAAHQEVAEGLSQSGKAWPAETPPTRCHIEV